jgi:proton glutamate symport protein
MFILLGVDQFLDMGRTTVNVVGNCLASAIVARWEGEFRTEKPSPSAVGVLSEQ